MSSAPASTLKACIVRSVFAGLTPFGTPCLVRLGEVRVLATSRNVPAKCISWYRKYLGCPFLALPQLYDANEGLTVYFIATENVLMSHPTPRAPRVTFHGTVTLVSTGRARSRRTSALLPGRLRSVGEPAGARQLLGPIHPKRCSKSTRKNHSVYSMAMFSPVSL